MDENSRHLGDGEEVVDELDESTDPDVVQRVIQCVAIARDVAPDDLPPLYEVIDPDALASLYTDGDAGTRHVRFEFAETEVLVTDQGTIRVVPDGAEE